MSVHEDVTYGIEPHDSPIDVVETMACHHDWDFDRINDDQIAMAIKGQWRTYSVTIAWSGCDETLRLVCSYVFEPPEKHTPPLSEALNLVNNQCWLGAFVHWPKEKMMVWRYALALQGCDVIATEQVGQIIERAIGACERFYPCFQLIGFQNMSPEQALQCAIADTCGRA